MAVAFELERAPRLALVGKRPPWRRWTPEEDATLLRLHEAGWPTRAIADHLGRTFLATQGRKRILRGPSYGRHFWTPERDQRLICLLESHTPWRDIARLLGKPQSSCQHRAHLLGVSFRSASGYTVAEVLRLLGRDHKAVRGWAQRGLLRVQRSRQRTGRGCYGFVAHEDLVAFLADESAWHLWEPERIADHGLREWAIEQRRGLRFLTTTEAAPLLCMTPLAVQLAIREGRLRGVQKGERGAPWLIRSDWLRLAEPRSLKGRPKPPNLTDQEVEYILTQWGRRPATAIARELGRSETIVTQVADRHGLARLGRGFWKKLAAGQRGGG